MQYTERVIVDKNNWNYSSVYGDYWISRRGILATNKGIKLIVSNSIAFSAHTINNMLFDLKNLKDADLTL